MNHPFIILEESSFQIIICIDFLKHFNAKLYYNTDTMILAQCTLEVNLQHLKWLQYNLPPNMNRKPPILRVRIYRTE